MVFARGERNRQADRARTARLSGNVGRNLGDMPYIMDHVLHDHFWNAYSDSLRVFSATTYQFTAAGSGTFSSNTTPTCAVLSTSTTANSKALLSLGSRLTGYTRDATLRARWKVSAIDNTTMSAIGFVDRLTDAFADDGIYIGAIGALSTSHFTCLTRSAGVASAAILNGTGGRATIPLDTSWHDTTIVCDSTAGEIRFYMDRQLAASIAQDIPTQSLGLIFGAENGTTGGTDRTFTLDVIDVSEAAP